MKKNGEEQEEAVEKNNPTTVCIVPTVQLLDKNVHIL